MSDHVGTLLTFLFFTGLQAWPLIYLAWFVQTAVSNAGCSSLGSVAHTVAKIIVWADIAGIILMFLAVVWWYGREKANRGCGCEESTRRAERAWRAAISSSAIDDAP